MALFHGRKIGFTLLEIVITIIVVGTLAGFSIPFFVNTIQEARERDAVLQLEAIKGMEENLFAASGQYWPADGSTQSTGGINTNLKLSIVENEMEFRCSGDGSSFTCTAYHPNAGSPDWAVVTSDSAEPRCTNTACPNCTPSGCPYRTY